jgi:hypothetical protein
MKTTQPCKLNFAILSLLFMASGAMAQDDAITVKKVGALPADPTAAEWQQAPAKEVAVAPQQVTMPSLEKGSVDKLSVQGLTDGKAIALRISWSDNAADANVDVARFSDALAVQLPLTKDASPMMGHRGGGKVQILYWKGLCQKDMDEHFQDVQDVHPNYWSDLYWFAEGQFPYRVPESFNDPVSQQWFIGLQAGNPVSSQTRTQPAQELVAEGWGTLTAQPESVTTAKGVWADGKWAVVLSRPLKTEDPNDYQFEDKGQMAFAVWQGGDGNVGGRKHWSNNWVAYQVQ